MNDLKLKNFKLKLEKINSNAELIKLCLEFLRLESEDSGRSGYVAIQLIEIIDELLTTD